MASRLLMPWQETNPGLLEEVRKLVETKLPTWHLVLESGKIFTRGSMFLQDPEQEIEIDRFDVEIEFPEDYPDGIPKVRETGGKLVRDPDHHFFADDGRACLFLPDEQWKYYPRGMSIVDFINGPVQRFFLWQAAAAQGISLPHRSHGEKGRLEYYYEELGLADANAVVAFLEILQVEQIKGHHICYCGSRLALRKCQKAHMDKLLEMQKRIPRKQIRLSLDGLLKLMRPKI